jgi:hypothetical protein
VNRGNPPLSAQALYPTAATSEFSYSLAQLRGGSSYGDLHLILYSRDRSGSDQRRATRPCGTATHKEDGLSIQMYRRSWLVPAISGVPLTKRWLGR